MYKNKDKNNPLTTQVASDTILLVMTVGIWIWGFSLLVPQALIQANSG